MSTYVLHAQSHDALHQPGRLIFLPHRSQSLLQLADHRADVQSLDQVREAHTLVDDDVPCLAALVHGIVRSNGQPRGRAESAHPIQTHPSVSTVKTTIS